MLVYLDVVPCGRTAYSGSTTINACIFWVHLSNNFNTSTAISTGISVLPFVVTNSLNASFALNSTCVLIFPCLVIYSDMVFAICSVLECVFSAKKTWQRRSIGGCAPVNWSTGFEVLLGELELLLPLRNTGERGGVILKLSLGDMLPRLLLRDLRFSVVFDGRELGRRIFFNAKKDFFCIKHS